MNINKLKETLKQELSYNFSHINENDFLTIVNLICYEILVYGKILNLNDKENSIYMYRIGVTDETCNKKTYIEVGNALGISTSSIREWCWKINKKIYRRFDVENLDIIDKNKHISFLGLPNNIVNTLHVNDIKTISQLLTIEDIKFLKKLLSPIMIERLIKIVHENNFVFDFEKDNNKNNLIESQNKEIENLKIVSQKHIEEVTALKKELIECRKIILEYETMLAEYEKIYSSINNIEEKMKSIQMKKSNFQR